MIERLKDRLLKTVKAALCHRSLYGQLCGCHSFAAWATEKPEIYVPMALVYLVLALVPDEH